MSNYSLGGYGNRKNIRWLSLPRDERAAAFDAKYGEGRYNELLGMFRDIRASYAEIARTIGVSRESVRLWHDGIFPKKKNTGIQRQARATLRARKEKVLKYPLVRSFYDALPDIFREDGIGFVGYGNFLQRHVRLNGKDVFLRMAIMRNTSANGPVYTLRKSERKEPDFYFFMLGEKDFLFLPDDILPPQTMFTDKTGSKYYGYKNNFDALTV